MLEQRRAVNWLPRATNGTRTRADPIGSKYGIRHSGAFTPLAWTWVLSRLHGLLRAEVKPGQTSTSQQYARLTFRRPRTISALSTVSQLPTGVHGLGDKLHWT